MADDLPLPLIKGRRIKLATALAEENDILLELSYPKKRLEFFLSLWRRLDEIEELVSRHLGVPKETCKASAKGEEWRHGTFNCCVPVCIDSPRSDVKKVFIRFPLPFKVGEEMSPGNAEEKIRCEAATYIWLQSNCPDVPIPCLRAFGFPGGQSFSAPQNAPLFARIAWFFRRSVLRLFGYPVPSPYVPRRLPCSINSGYLIVDCIQEGKMLSESWNELRHDQGRRANLFTGLSRIMLSLARVRFPRIGSFTIDNHGVISLTNRPLTCKLQQLENGGIPTNIPRDLTYATSDAYYTDLLTCHDNRIRHMPNSINDVEDGETQLASLTIMRALLPHFTDRDLRHGPFVLMLTDLHQSNVFVNDDWNITAIIDLEWATVQPIEMQHPPWWLTGQSIDGIHGEELEAYGRIHAEFMAAFEKEERSLGNTDILRTRTMRKGWDNGSYWYFAALDCLNGLWTLYSLHIQDMFAPSGLEVGKNYARIVSVYWARNAREFIATKVRDKEMYSDRLRERFAAPRTSKELEMLEQSRIEVE